MTLYKLSLHSHTSDFAHFIFRHPNKKSYLLTLVKNLLKKHGNVVLGVSNFNNDGRYESLLSISKSLPKEYLLDHKYEEYFFSIEHKEKKIFFIKTDEIETDKGHILIVGYKGKIRKRKLDEVLKEANNQNCPIIANHPLHVFGTSYYLFKKIFKKKTDISLSNEELKKHKNDFDAIELNSYFPEDWKRIKRFAKTQNMAVIADSDAHFLNEIFTSWYEVDDLDFDSPEKFKKSLKKELKKRIQLHAKKYGYEAIYKHSFQIILEVLGKKIGLISN